MSFWKSRFVVVTGKGGVGRTTVSCALAHAAASKGLKSCVAELYGLDHVAQLYGLPGRAYRPRTVAPGVDTLSLTPYECLSEFGTRKLKIGALSRLIFQNRVARALLDGVPGLHDLVQLGKLENLVADPLPGDPRYDFVVLDAPATGHGVTLIAAARALREMTRVGPFAELAEIIERFLDDEALTRFVMVTLPEELPASETLEFISSLGEDASQLEALVVNQLRPPPLPDRPAWSELRPVLSHLEELVVIADDAWEQHAAQRRVLDRLESEAPRAAGRPLQVISCPRLPGALARAEIDELSTYLGEIL